MDQEKWDRHCMRLAFLTALNLSKDPRTKVGAVLVAANQRDFSTGYNGFPRGVEERTEDWNSTEKYERVIHAEENALYNAPFDVAGGTLYCTLKPCYKCLGRILNAGIKRVVYYEPARPHDPRQDIVEEWSQHPDIQVEQLGYDRGCEILKFHIEGFDPAIAKCSNRLQTDIAVSLTGDGREC